MWYLTSDNDARVIYIISQVKDIIIGRSLDNEVCNFAIPDDPSISRKHATLTVIEKELILHDLGSRYGTFINNSTDKIEMNKNITLKENDIVKFGKMNSIWKVNTLSINTCTSTLKGENLQKLRQSLSKIGGVLKNEWDDSCNYLTMPAITLTIKVVLALVQGSHIVTTDFWDNLVESIENFTPMPDPGNFLPTIVESTLNRETVSFLPKAPRQYLFEDKKFIFFSKRQYEMYKPVLIKSGATPQLLGECRMTVSNLCADNVIVIQYIATGTTQETQAQNNQINDIVNQLKKKGRRVIPDPEIGLAVLYCSIDKYCNPCFSFTSEVVKQNSGQLQKTASKVLAPESQESAIMSNEKENVKIDESCASDVDLNGDKAVKRKLSDFTSDIDLNPNKKVATTEVIANIPKESTKRKQSDEPTSSNPSKKQAMDKENNGEEVLGEKSDDMFNFINNISNNVTENKTKKLNLMKPQKRKLNESREDGDLFNFMPTDEKSDEEEPSKKSIFSSNNVKKDYVPMVKNKVSVTPEDISAMRGTKLKQLMDNISKDTSGWENTIKEEKTDELEEKMNDLDLCDTVVITFTNLVVKREPKTEPDNTSITVKNFKKFKKVWPLRKQVSLPIPDLTDTYSAAY